MGVINLTANIATTGSNLSGKTFVGFHQFSEG
jgi:hypothetical protein